MTERSSKSPATGGTVVSKRNIGAMCMLLAFSGSARTDEASAVAAVKQFGGSIERDDKMAGKPVVTVIIHNAKITDADLKILKEFKELTELELNCANVTDAGLKELKDLKQLTVLSLDFTKMTGA